VNRLEATDGLWAPSRRALTVGLVMTVTIIASEALSVVTIMPIVARDLGGLRLYGWVFSSFMLASLVGTAIEFYDFYIYGTAAALVLGRLFFPAADAGARRRPAAR